MATITECEIRIIEKLIAVFSNTLSCYSSETNASDVLVVEKVLQVLLSQNESLHIKAESNGRGIMEQILDDPENSTNAFMIYGNTEIPTTSDGAVVGVGDDRSRTNKLHQLEIIKVFVLIFVISIILLTTCRMVFQLFIRFRPEKPPLD